MDYQTAFTRVKDEVTLTLTTSPQVVSRYMTHLADAQGKNIRAQALITCAQDGQGNVPEDAIKVAAAIELLHLATLVHDDVIDDADLRRGAPTLQKQFGRKTAVICGDYLLSVALNKAASISDRQQYLDLNMPDYVARICLGELSQHINNGNLSLTVYQYLKIISGKTAALFEAAFFAGAMLNHGSQRELRIYRRLGFYVGMIFQLTDDLMDYEATRDAAGKPVRADLEHNVITLPVIHALGQADVLNKDKTSLALHTDVAAAVRETGGLAYTKMVAGKYHKKALQLINRLDISPDKAMQLVTIANHAMRL